MGTNLFLTCTLAQVNTKSFFNSVQLGNAYREWKVLGIWINPAFSCIDTIYIVTPATVFLRERLLQGIQ